MDVVSVWRVVRPPCSGRAASGGVEHDMCEWNESAIQGRAESGGWRSSFYLLTFFMGKKFLWFVRFAALGLLAFAREGYCTFPFTNEYPRYRSTLIPDYAPGLNQRVEISFICMRTGIGLPLRKGSTT